MYTYLLIVFFSALIPFILSFETKVSYYKKWTSLFPALAVTATLFVIWDEFFTTWLIWGFNKEYLIGWYLGHLPVEEVLFFILIPYACVFIYEVLRYFQINFFKHRSKWVSYALIFICLFTGLIHLDKTYTSTTFVLLGILIISIEVWGNPSYMGLFYTAYIFSFVPFIIVNGLLTNGIKSISTQPVVWYNSSEILGIRIWGIPLEDFFYSMLLLLMNIALFEFLKNNQKK